MVNTMTTQTTSTFWSTQYAAARAANKAAIAAVKACKAKAQAEKLTNKITGAESTEWHDKYAEARIADKIVIDRVKTTKAKAREEKAANALILKATATARAPKVTAKQVILNTLNDLKAFLSTKTEVKHRGIMLQTAEGNWDLIKGEFRLNKEVVARNVIVKMMSK